MKLEGHSRFYSEIRIEALADFTALNLLCSNEAVSRLKTATESLSPRDLRNFSNGYLLSLAIPLSELLHFMVKQADLLGLEHDDQISDWQSYRMPSRGESLLSGVSNQSSDLARICRAFDDLRAALRKSSGDIAKTLETIERCLDFAKVWEPLFVEAEVVCVDTGERPNTRRLPVSLCLAERVLDYAGRLRSATTLAYSWVWSNGNDLGPVDDRFVLESETHLSNTQQIPNAGGFPEEWYKGFWFGINLMLELEGVSLATRPEPDYDQGVWRKWYSELESRVRRSTQDGSWPTHKYGLEEFLHTTVRNILNKLEGDVSTALPEERLAAILGPDEVHLMSDSSAADAFQLDVLLTGAIAKSGGSKVRVLLLDHTVADDPRKWVSVSLRLPQFGTLGSNFSVWYLFYKMYHRGDVYDTDVARNISFVKQLLQRLETDIEVEEIDGLDSEDFLPLCVPPAFRAMRQLSLDAVEVNANLRSGNSELLAGLWMAEQGYRPVRVSFKHASLGNYEFDAIGVMDDQCLVIEVKSADLMDYELRREISKLEQKVEHLSGRLDKLANSLGAENKIASVSGLFVFLGDLDRFTPSGAHVALWGFDDFATNLRASDIPGRIVDLMDKSNIIHAIDPRDFLGDLFFTS